MMFSCKIEGFLFLLLMGSKGFQFQTIIGLNAYSAYQPSINVNINYSLSFQIKIDNFLGLILYAEDEKTNTFVSLTLLKGAKLRLDIGLFYYYYQSSNISVRELRTPDYLSSIVDLSKVESLLQEWHTIIVSVYKTSVALQFNNINEKVNIPNSYQAMERMTDYIGGKIFFGGLPKRMKQDATRRVFFSSAIEPSFNGRISAVRIIRFISSMFLIPILIEYESETAETCYFDSNFCRYCSQTRKCSNFQYVTIDQNSEISYDFPTDSTFEINRSISFNFKTKQDNSFLYYLGYYHDSKLKPLQFMSLFIQNGILNAMFSTSKLGNPEVYTKKISCKSIYKQCSDNKWHSVTMKHFRNNISVSIEENAVHFESFDPIKTKASAEFIIAMYPEPFQEFWNVYSKSSKPLHSFRGCMSKIYLEQNNVKINVAEMVFKNVFNFKTKGAIYTNKCMDLFPPQPITFHSVSDYIHFQGPQFFKTVNIDISFRTLKENCLLLLHTTERQTYFHVIEIRNSKLFMSAMYGPDVVGQFISHSNVSNGEDHSLEIYVQVDRIYIELDGIRSRFNISTGNVPTDIMSKFYIGAAPKSQLNLLPSQIWSTWLRYFFSGCVLMLKVNEEPIQLDLLILKNSSIKPGCHTLKEIFSMNVCANKQCNHGSCQREWDQPLCNCRASNFTEPTCSRGATIAEFNGYQFMRITLRNQYQSEVEDISLRFKSTLPDGLILSTESQFSGTPDKLQIFMNSGNIFLLLNFGQGNKKFKTNENCFDGRWHTVKIKRRRNNLKIWIDQNYYNFNFQSTKETLLNDLIHVGKINKSKNDFFVGHMMHFIFNGVNYFELAKDNAPINIEVTASLAQTTHIKQFPVYFQSSESYLLIAKVNIFGDFHLEFLLRTKEPSGLVLLLKGDSGDYLFLEMVDRVLHIVYNWGSGYKRKASENGPLNDNQWHSVKIIRHQSSTHSFAFRVDGFPEGDRADVPVEKGGINFNHYGRMYLGGHKQNESIVMFDNEMPRSKNGFRGCIASFYVNNTIIPEESLKYKDLLKEALEINGVQENCPNSFGDENCFVHHCAFGGSCIQQMTGVGCDCTMTSFTGSNCQEASSTIQFLKQPSYIIFKLSIPQNNTIDKLSLGFQTNTIKEAYLISILSSSPKYEYLTIRIKIVEGRGFVEVNYNLGGNTYSLLETRQNVVDGLYHIVRFIREGVKGTLQIDSLSKRIYVPHTQNDFTRTIEHSLIIIGSRLTESNDFFQGYISGVNLNNIPLTDIVNNHFEQNIQLINKSNIVIVPNFIPRLSDRSSLSFRQSEEEAKSPKENPTANRIVIAKLNCPGVTEEEKNQCQFSNPKGLVKPGITYRKIEKNIKPGEMISSQTTTLVSTYHPTNTEYDMRLSKPDVNIYSNIDSTIRKKINNNININLWLIVAFSFAGAFLLVALSCLIYRCSTKDEGSYNVEDDRVCIQTRDKGTKLNLKPLKEDKTVEGLLSNGARKNIRMKKRCGDNKEWYV